MSEPTERLTIARLAGIYAGIRLDSQSLNSSKPASEATEAGETEASESSEVVESAVADSHVRQASELICRVALNLKLDQGGPFPRAIDEIEEDAHAEELFT